MNLASFIPTADDPVLQESEKFFRSDVTLLVDLLYEAIAGPEVHVSWPDKTRVRSPVLVQTASHTFRPIAWPPALESLLYEQAPPRPATRPLRVRTLGLLRRFAGWNRLPLDRLVDRLELNDHEIGRILHASPAEVRAWRWLGAPPAMTARLLIMVEVAEFLAPRFKPGVLPGLARTPASAYGNLTMIEMFAIGGEQTVLDAVRRSFDWGASG
jgi:hypothetical protein